MTFLMSMGFILVAVIMGITWIIYTKNHEPSIVDVSWTLSVGLLGWLYYFISGPASLRENIFLVMISFWTLRLSWLLIRRYLDGKRDIRYEELDHAFGEGKRWKYALFFAFQAVGAWVLSIPFAIISRSYAPLGLWDLLGILLFFIAWTGEYYADIQLKRFRANPENAGKVCHVGWWRYSRHPNYFFEWLIWCSFAFLALSGPDGWMGLISPALMLYFLLQVTGVPPTESHMLRTKGDVYREYQRTTHTFFPWFPKKEKPHA